MSLVDQQLLPVPGENNQILNREYTGRCVDH